MTSSESNNSNAIEVDGIYFETLVAQPIVTIPPYGEVKTVQFGVRITNQTATLYRFDLQRFIPEFLVLDGRVIRAGINQNHVRDVQDSDIPLIMPGKSLDFLMEAELIWFRHGFLVIRGGEVMYGGIWSLYDILSRDYYDFHPGKYLIRLNYENRLAERELSLLSSGETIINQFWTGQILTPFAELTIQ